MCRYYCEPRIRFLNISYDSISKQIPSSGYQTMMFTSERYSSKATYNHIWEFRIMYRFKANKQKTKWNLYSRSVQKFQLAFVMTVMPTFHCLTFTWIGIDQFTVYYESNPLWKQISSSYFDLYWQYFSSKTCLSICEFVQNYLLN